MPKNKKTTSDKQSWATGWWDKEDGNLLNYVTEKAQDEAEKYDRSVNKKFVQQVARNTLLTNRLDEILSKFNGRVIPSKYALKKHTEPTERVLNLFISDTHFGADLDQRELPYQYGPVEQARRMAWVILQACEYKQAYRKETELKISLAGDIIQGQLHDPREGDPLSWQLAASISMLTDAISFASQHFKKVTVYCTPGNHGRNKSRHHERGTNQKWDAHETSVYVGVKNGFRNVPNVEFRIPLTPYFTYENFDKKVFGTHGDTVFKPGYPGSSIDVKSIEAQANKFNASLPDHKEYSLFIMGHVHVGALVHLANGSIVITNGPLIPSDGYALSIGLTEVFCGQTMFESVPGHIVGDYRFIKVDGETDKDASLDLIVKPFTAF